MIKEKKIDDRQCLKCIICHPILFLPPRRVNRENTLFLLNGISAVTAPEYQPGSLDSFTGVAENYFYYKGSSVTNIKLLDGEKSIVDFNGNICIFPDKVYYRYLPDLTLGK